MPMPLDRHPVNRPSPGASAAALPPWSTSPLSSTGTGTITARALRGADDGNCGAASTASGGVRGDARRSPSSWKQLSSWAGCLQTWSSHQVQRDLLRGSLFMMCRVCVTEQAQRVDAAPRARWSVYIACWKCRGLHTRESRPPTCDDRPRHIPETPSLSVSSLRYSRRRHNISPVSVGGAGLGRGGAGRVCVWWPGGGLRGQAGPAGARPRVYVEGDRCTVCVCGRALQRGINNHICHTATLMCV